MTMNNIIDKNYDSIVKRGFISPSTKMIDFIKKIEEETNEFKKAFEIIGKIPNIQQRHFDDMELELADIILVCLNIAKHYNIDIESRLNEKIEINYKRVKSNV